MFRLATIGYEGATLAEVIAKLWTAGVTLVVDVRAIAASRRPGFSKGILAASLAEAGIDYRHLRALGTPKAGRVAAHAGRTEEMRIIYEGHLHEPEAQAALGAAAELALHQPAALLCFEADAGRCHRAIVAQHIHERIGCEIVDL
ncbi:MAG TPA: DUF488 domain-containing protein [Caulobacteraceae bacterium]